MIGRLFLTAVAVATLSSPCLAQTTPAAAPAAKPVKVLKYLTESDIDPKRILPPPSADGSAAQRFELAELHRIIDGASPERKAQAQWDADHEDMQTIYAATLGAGFDLTKLPATSEVLGIIQNDASVAASGAKKTFLRKRPWVDDATIKPCETGDKPLTSYPSGHATLGYSLGLTLAVLIPEKAQPVMARAADYAYSRAVCGSHYPADTQASQALATAFVTALLKDPAFQAKLAAAHTELQAAKLTQ